MILSALFPGLGQIYNRQPVKGVLFLGVAGVLSWLLVRAVPTDPLVLIERGIGSVVLLPVVALLAVSLWSIVDAGRGASREIT